MKYPQYDSQYDLVLPYVNSMRMVNLVHEVASDVLNHVSPAVREWTPELYIETFARLDETPRTRGTIHLRQEYASATLALLAQSVGQVHTKGTITKSLARTMCKHFAALPREIQDMDLAEDGIWMRFTLLSRR